MASAKIFLLLVLGLSCQVHGAGLLERSYEYVMSLGKNFAPNLMSLVDCMATEDVWACAKTKAGQFLDGWDQDLNKQRSLWQAEADAEITQTGRSIEEMPSKLGRDVENSLLSLTDLVQHGMARALSRKHGVDTITVSASANKKKKDKKKHKQPQVVMMEKTEDPGVPRGFLEDAWSIGEKALDSVAEHAIAEENTDNGVEDKSSVDEQRGKKKKKKKAILKLLLLGAVLKAKIGTLLQILSFKLQVKFFIIALIGLAINLARFWIDVKKQHQQQPQKVIYYEHAQHQHHYDEHEEPAWGPWQRSIDPEEQEAELEAGSNSSPYRAQERRQFLVPRT